MERLKKQESWRTDVWGLEQNCRSQRERIGQRKGEEGRRIRRLQQKRRGAATASRQLWPWWPSQASSGAPELALGIRV